MENLDFTNSMAPNAPMLKPALRAGLLFSAVYIVLALIPQLIGNPDQSTIFGFINFAVVVVGVVLSIRYYRDQANNRRLSYGQGVLFSLLTSLIVAVLSSIFQIISLSTFGKAFFEKMKEVQFNKMSEQGLPEESIDMAMNFMSPGFIVASSFFGVIIFFLIVGLIASAFLKTN
jgi:Na+-driven multidrug efflux pump